MHVDGRGPDSVVLEGEGERGLVHESAARGVDEEGAGPHLLDGVLVDQMVVVFVQSTVEGDAVRFE